LVHIDEDNSRLTTNLHFLRRIFSDLRIPGPALKAAARTLLMAIGNPPENFSAFVKSEIDEWGKVVRDANFNAR
jgi:hypothetical protein